MELVPILKGEQGDVLAVWRICDLTIVRPTYSAFVREYPEVLEEWAAAVVNRLVCAGTWPA